MSIDFDRMKTEAPLKPNSKLFGKSDPVHDVFIFE